MGMEPVVIPSGNFWATTFKPFCERKREVNDIRESHTDRMNPHACIRDSWDFNNLFINILNWKGTSYFPFADFFHDDFCLLSVSCLNSPPDNMKRFSKPLSHMVVAAWLAILSSSSYKIMIFPDAFFCIVVKDFTTSNKQEYTRNWNVHYMRSIGFQYDSIENKHFQIHISGIKGYIIENFFRVWVHCPW